MKSAALFDGLWFDLAPRVENALVASEVDIGGRQVVQAIVVAAQLMGVTRGGALCESRFNRLGCANFCTGC